MQIKKTARVFAATLMIFAILCSLPVSGAGEDGEITYSDALQALKDDMADPFTLNTVHEAYLYCLSTDTELLSFDSSPETFEPPADTAKLLTALTAYDLIDELSPSDIETDLSQTVKITQAMIDEAINRKMVSGSNNVRFDYRSGNTVTYRDLLRTLLMHSANDSAVALAYGLCEKNMSVFADKMNEKAKEIGMTDSHFTNSLGAHDESMYTSAKDIFILANEFYKNETLMSFVGSDHIRLDSGKLAYSRNFLVSKYYNSGKDYRDSSVNGMIVGKGEQGDVIVRSANYNGFEYICVLLGAQRDAHFTYSYTVSGELIKWAFKNHSFVKILDKNRPVSSVPVKNARENDSVPVVPTEDLSKYILSDAAKTGKLTTSVILSETSLKAPVAKGKAVGTVEVYYNGEKISECTLVTACEISENTTSSMIQTVWGAISSRDALTVYAVVFSAVAVYVLINSIVRQRRKAKTQKDA